MSDRSYQSDSSNPAPNALQSALRRWPLLVLGAVAGAIVGFLGYTTQPPTYQSTAQLQVIKRDTARTPDMRSGYIDDYVANQLEQIRSESILIAATKSAKMQEASAEFLAHMSEDELAAYRTVKAGLSVTRSKETGLGPVGNSIVNLAYTCGDPRDAQVVLNAIIETYQKELSNASGNAFKDRIASLKSQIDELKKERKAAEDIKLVKTEERTRITPESPETITQRWTTDKGEVFKIDLQLADVESNLEQIKIAGQNQSNRLLTIAMLTGSRRGIDPSVNTLESQLFQLELQRRLKGETLGPDHPEMKQLEGQIQLVKREQERLNPDKAALDDLSVFEKQLQQKKLGLEKQKAKLEERITEDKTHFEAIRPMIGEINRQEAVMQSRDRQIFELDTQLATTNATAAASQTEVYEARVNNKPRAGLKVGPVLMLWLVPGVMLGALIGGGLAVLVELRDKSFRTPAEIRARLNAPVIGHLPNIRLNLPREGDVSAAYDPSLVAAIRPRSVEAEAYRGVRAQVMQTLKNETHKVLQVTSPTPGDGKSTLAANLAISLAQSGKRVVLIDCDFRKPRVHKLFALPKPEVGLASVTSGDTPLDDAVRHSDVTHLDLLPCGPRPDNPAELLSGPRFLEVLGELQRRYDFVIVDTPPLLAVSDPRVVAPRVDGVLLVFRITRKVRPLAERAREYLTDMGANLLGVVVNGGGAKSDEYGYGYNYTYAYDYDYEYAEQANGPDDKSKF